MRFRRDGDAAWTRLRRRWPRDRVPEEVEIDPRVVDWHVSVALTHRQVLERALAGGAEQALVLEEHALLHSDFATRFAQVFEALRELSRRGESWSTVHLGAVTWGAPLTPIDGASVLARCADFGGTFALLYHAAAMRRLVEQVPATIPKLADWTAEHASFDRYLASMPGRLLAQPALASLVELLPYESPHDREAFLD